jgi:class 3 adenylate cyclase
MTETRRLAAIMAVDVVGYSRLMGEDEAVLPRSVVAAPACLAPRR